MTGRTRRLKTALVNTVALSGPAKGASKTVLADELETFHVDKLFCLLEQTQDAGFQPIMIDLNLIHKCFCYINRF